MQPRFTASRYSSNCETNTGLQRPSQSGDDLQTGACYVIWSLPRIDFSVINPPILKKGGVDLAVLMIGKAVHKEAGFQIESLPILRISGELIRVFEGHHRLALLPPFHVAIARRLGGRTSAIDASVGGIKSVFESVID